MLLVRVVPDADDAPAMDVVHVRHFVLVLLLSKAPSSFNGSYDLVR